MSIFYKSKSKNEKIINNNEIKKKEKIVRLKYRVKIYIRLNEQTDSVFWNGSFDHLEDAVIFAERMNRTLISLGVFDNTWYCVFVESV